MKAPSFELLDFFKGRFAARTVASPTLARPVSQACTQAQMEDPIFGEWCEKTHLKPAMHRKVWEFVYILQALSLHGKIKAGVRGLGFGVGQEPLPAYLASQGVEILGTDLEAEVAADLGWIKTGQHTASKEALNARKICQPDEFERLVSFRFMDMNSIHEDLRGKFDFCWSACALEHLGSIKHGLDFIKNSIDCLTPGGLAVHTTELNCTSNRKTLEHPSTVLFRRKDLQKLAKQLRAKGHRIELNFNLGDQPLDKHIDVPPYTSNPHLKLQVAEWTTTSFGLIVQKGTGA